MSRILVRVEREKQTKQVLLGIFSVQADVQAGIALAPGNLISTTVSM